MELDDFKNTFNRLSMHTPKHDLQQLQQLLRQKSNSALHRFLRNFYMEMIISVLFLIVLLWKVYHKLDAIQTTISFALVIGLALYQFYLFFPTYMNIKKLSENSQLPTRDWVNALVVMVEKFVVSYKRFMLWAIPLGFLIGCLIGFFANADIKVDNVWGFFTIPFAQLLSFILVMTLIVRGLAWLFNRTMVQRLYTRYLDDLKKYQFELDELSKEAAKED